MKKTTISLDDIKPAGQELKEDELKAIGGGMARSIVCDIKGDRAVCSGDDMLS